MREAIGQGLPLLDGLAQGPEAFVPGQAPPALQTAAGFPLWPGLGTRRHQAAPRDSCGPGQSTAAPPQPPADQPWPVEQGQHHIGQQHYGPGRITQPGGAIHHHGALRAGAATAPSPNRNRTGWPFRGWRTHRLPPTRRSKSAGGPDLPGERPAPAAAASGPDVRR